MKISKAAAVKFSAKVQKIDGCWAWIGHREWAGYGTFLLNGQRQKAHRVSWTIYRGPIPHGLKVLHKCDHRDCVNPEHLFLGTQLENVRDMHAKDRRSKPDQIYLCRPFPIRIPRPRCPLIIKFWSLVGAKTKTGCLPWVGRRNSYGYGILATKPLLTAHRFILAYSVGQTRVSKHLVSRHKCDNPWCVNPEHLVFGTLTSNVRDRHERGRSAKGTNIWQSKATENVVIAIRASNENDATLATRFGLSKIAIWQIRSGATWKHIPGARGRYRDSKTLRRYRSKLTAENVAQIKASKELLRVIAARYNVTPSLISDIRRDKIWRHIDPASVADLLLPRGMK